uniref:RING-type domain-containing protein n=2 Tax=Magallana gigas TaxID=29159 RepID=A0A8W8JLR2_MAGGI|nr:putative inhibitor of apoptosis [Crassostrea gigas]XP_034335618.1 putative inhibitor of apoptosis [Crassostrea gigas]XP_034335619.1 putative inhibitor of apoptosis [Crassostrea gigas]
MTSSETLQMNHWTQNQGLRSLDEFVQNEILCQRKYNIPSTDRPICHSMNMELIRLKSFSNFPSSKAVSALRLARQGFYYSMEYDVTICFACDCRKRDWRSGDDIEVVHRNMSPDCPLLSSQPTSNIQIGNKQSNGHCINEPEQRINASGNDLSSNNNEIPSSLTSYSVSTGNKITKEPNADRKDKKADVQALASRKKSNDACGNDFPSSSNRHSSLLTSGSISFGNAIKAEPNIDNIDKKGSSKAPSSNKTANDLLTKTRKQQDKINAFIRNLDPLGINFDRPKYPSYSLLTVRVSSFADWPSTLIQTPRDLAVAGFLYAGYGDYTRCFFCGGGLRNWEAGDDPWTEHARWFPKCAFVRQNKGDEFVALVQIQHQELEAIGAPNENQAGDQASGPLTSTSELSSLPNVCNLPAFQSVLEMGYPSHVIQEAFDVLKNTKEYINIKAEEVMETILSRDDKPPSSAAKTSESVNNIITKSYEDIINVNKQQTNSSVSITKESGEADTPSLIEENRQLKDLRMCKICMENDASIAMLPCGHLCCCTDCAPAMRKCPICQQFVKGTVRTWLA